jgi:tetratricopeptide (TPR) repeat protein
MDMDANLKSKLKKLLILLGIIAGVFAVLAGIYFYGSLHYPRALQQAYEAKDCETVLASHSMIIRFYPYRSLQESTTGPALECALYTNAEKLQADGKWQDAYQAFKTCAETYPDGILASDAHEQAAASLLSQAAEQQEQKAYAESVETLQRVMAEYPSQPEAAERYVDLHLAWSSEYQSRGEYPAAEEVLLSLRDWSQAGEYEAHVAESQSALAVLYLAWGESHQSAGELVPAMAKYRQSVEAAPDSEFASLAAEKQVEILLAQGDAYMAAGDFQLAIDMYQSGVGKAKTVGKDTLDKATASAYISWSQRDLDIEDYYQALEKIENAVKAPLSDPAKQELESFRQEIYTAFANSSGEQATQLIAEASQVFCSGEAREFHPIFGLNSDADKMTFEGESINQHGLPEEWLPTIPAEFRYVVCVELEPETIQEKIVTIKRFSGIGHVDGAVFVRTDTFLRFRWLWQVKVFDVRSGELVGNTTIAGSLPPPFPSYLKDEMVFFADMKALVGSQNATLPPAIITGSRPEISDLVSWLIKNIRE